VIQSISESDTIHFGGGGGTGEVEKNPGFLRACSIADFSAGLLRLQQSAIARRSSTVGRICNGRVAHPNFGSYYASAVNW
jgi:hypothetical protein